MEDHGFLECERAPCTALGTSVRRVRVSAFSTVGVSTSDFKLWCVACCGLWARGCAVCGDRFAYSALDPERSDLCHACRAAAAFEAERQQRENPPADIAQAAWLTPPPAIVVAIAVSLYGFNVSASERAERIYEHFGGACMDVHDLVELLDNRGKFAATELPYPSAKVYVEHAMARYADEAYQRAAANERVPAMRVEGE